jgi:hypothetical protein
MIASIKANTSAAAIRTMRLRVKSKIAIDIPVPSRCRSFREGERAD